MELEYWPVRCRTRSIKVQDFRVQSNRLSLQHLVLSGDLRELSPRNTRLPGAHASKLVIDNPILYIFFVVLIIEGHEFFRQPRRRHIYREAHPVSLAVQGYPLAGAQTLTDTGPIVLREVASLSTMMANAKMSWSTTSSASRTSRARTIPLAGR